jgi:hypothetical protein
MVFYDCFCRNRHLVTREGQDTWNKKGNQWHDMSSPASENAFRFQEFMQHGKSEEAPLSLYVSSYNLIHVMLCLCLSQQH